ncbi:putative defense protein 3 [Gastrophryne carolinensis]
MAQHALPLLLVLMTFITISVSFPTGAPISACQTMMPGHVGIYPQPNPAPYIIKINSSVYQTGRPIEVQIVGSAYKGILLQARTFKQNTLFGEWLQPPNNTKILACPGNPVGAITHANTNIKDQSTTYLWMPPSTSVPPVLYFVATVAEAYDKYWLGIKSATIYKDGFLTITSDTNEIAWRLPVIAVMCYQFIMFL